MSSHRALWFVPATLLSLLATPVLGRSAEQYLAARQNARFDRRRSLADLEASPSEYRRRSVEVRGTVNGSMRVGADLTAMLSLDDRRTLMLVVPSADQGIFDSVSSQRVRVLLRGAASIGKTGLPFEVLAIALDSEIVAREPAPTPTPSASAQPAVATSPPSRGGPSRGGLTARPLPAAMGSVSALASRYLSPAAQAVYPRYRDFVAKCNRRLSAQKVDEITVSILYFAPRLRIDPRLVIALIIAESDFDPSSTSHKGAMGLGQIMPDEARSLKLTDPYNAIQNVQASVSLLKHKLELYREPGTADGILSLRQIQLAMAAYNAGPGAVRKYGGIPPYRETQGYVKRVLRLYRELSGG